MFLSLSLVLSLAGCAGWTLAAPTPQEVAPLPAKVRLTLIDGSHVTMRHAELRGDSVVGEVGHVERAYPTELIVRVAVPARSNARAFGWTMTRVAVFSGVLTLLLLGLRP